MADPVQGGIFGGMNFQPLGWDDPTAPKTPAISGATIDTSNPTISGSTLALDNSASPAAPSAAGAGGATPAAASSGGLGDFIASYFMRGVIIILGFVFVAAGLTMFKPQAILQKVTS